MPLRWCCSRLSQHLCSTAAPQLGQAGTHCSQPSPAGQEDDRLCEHCLQWAAVGACGAASPGGMWVLRAVLRGVKHRAAKVLLPVKGTGGGNPEPLSHIPVPKLGKRNQCSPTLPISSRLQTTQPATLSFSLVFLPGPGAHGRYTASPEKNGT